MSVETSLCRRGGCAAESRIRRVRPCATDARAYSSLPRGMSQSSLRSSPSVPHPTTTIRICTTTSRSGFDAKLVIGRDRRILPRGANAYESGVKGPLEIPIMFLPLPALPPLAPAVTASRKKSTTPNMVPLFVEELKEEAEGWNRWGRRWRSRSRGRR